MWGLIEMNIKGLINYFRKNASSVQVSFVGKFSFNSNSQSDCDNIQGTFILEFDFRKILFHIRVSEGNLEYLNVHAIDEIKNEKSAIGEEYYPELKQLLKEIYSGLSEDMIYYYVSEAL